jgi:2-polyprenyl-3-methyl-5-hydroxy-6-metoxy-1,4-benzoquinol methylase
MKWLDRYLRDLRIRQAMPYIREGDRLLDVGCFDTTLLRRASPRVRAAVGIDPLATPLVEGNIRVVRGVLDESAAAAHGLLPGSFDCITMLAVLEHVPDPAAMAARCAALLAPGGRIVITVPEAKVDHILAVLRTLRLIHGMSLEEHHGYDTAQTRPVFEGAGLRTMAARKFEFGLNNLFVFERVGGAAELSADAAA